MNPAILRDLPEQLETERLLLRCPRPGDGAMVHEAVVESLAQLRAWGASLPWAMFEPSVEASETYCRQSQADYLLRNTFNLVILAKDGGGYVGGTGLHSIRWEVPKFEIGYWCRQRCQGQGLMTEAVTAVTRFATATLGARRIECLTDALNTPSRRVAERAGYTLEGILRQERVGPDGVLRDTCMYALTP